MDDSEFVINLKDYERELLTEMKKWDSRNDRFIFACNNGDDETSSKLLEYLLSKEMDVLDMLVNEEWRQWFRQFCKIELSVENVDFWEECEKYEKWTRIEHRIFHAMYLYNTYISSESRYAINIDENARKYVKERIDTFRKSPSRYEDLKDLFFNVKKLVKVCMSDTLQRFTRSQVFQEKISAVNDFKFEELVDRRNNNASLMHLCAKKNKIHCMELLMSKGADINFEDKTKATPFDYAINNNCVEAALFLLFNGANINLDLRNNRITSISELKTKYDKMSELFMDKYVNDSKEKLEDVYKVLYEVNNSSLTNLQMNYTRSRRALLFDIIDENSIDNHGIRSLYIVQHKKNLNRYNAFCVKFQKAFHALQYRNSNWKHHIYFKHNSLVPISNIFLQNNRRGDYEVYVIKVGFTTSVSMNISDIDQFFSTNRNVTMTAFQI